MEQKKIKIKWKKRSEVEKRLQLGEIRRDAANGAADELELLDSQETRSLLTST